MYWRVILLSLPVILLSLARTGLCFYRVNISCATTCEEFETGARFHPHHIIDSTWKIIYFWAETTEVRPIVFSLVDEKKLEKFRSVVDAVDPHLRPEWDRATFMMVPKPGVQILFVHMITPGAFRAIIKVEQRNKDRPHPPPVLGLADIRFKLEGRYMGMMCCEDMTAYVLARVDEVPETEEGCVAAASLLGLGGPHGRSHLYVKNLTRTEL